MIENKIFENTSVFKNRLQEFRSENKKIVFTNGCFDLLHKGHVLYLEEAKKLGQVLIVGLNSDASIKRLKGNSRPIKNIVDRSYVLAALKSVDAVLIFEEDTPLKLVEAIIPDVIVKGGDWKPEQIVGSDVVLKNGDTIKKFVEKEEKRLATDEQKIKKS